MVHRLTGQQACRIAVRAQLLDRQRPVDLLETVRRQTLLQVDPIKATAPSADLVLWSRLGADHDPEQLRAALNEQRPAELQGMIRPIEDMAPYRSEMSAWPSGSGTRDTHEAQREWVAANDRTRHEILDLLRTDGPLTAKAFPDTCDRPWRSSGWTDNKNIPRLLEFMAARGEVAVAGRHCSRPTTGWSMTASEPGSSFGFEYYLEMYKPAAKRRWGYYALPILYGDRLVGKLDAKAEPKEGVLVVNAIHQDTRFTAAMTNAIDAEIADLAGWLHLEEYRA